MSNSNERVYTDADYLARAISLEGERRSLAGDCKELWKQMKEAGKTKVDVKATKALARRHHEDGKVAEEREAVERRMEEILGEYANEPLGRAAVRAAVAVHVAGERVAV